MLLLRHGVGIWPDPQPSIGQAFPREQRARVKLAQWGDIAVANDMPGLDIVTFDDVLEQRDQRLDLRLAIGVPDPPVGCIGKAWVDDFDADGRRIQPCAPLPLAVTGMPGATALVHQLVHRRRAITNQVMATDLTVGEQCQRAFQRGIGVMQNNELDTVVLVRRRVAAVDAQARGATCDGEQQKGDQGFFSVESTSEASA